MSRVRLNVFYLNAFALDFHRARHYSGDIDWAERCRAYISSIDAIHDDPQQSLLNPCAPNTQLTKRIEQENNRLAQAPKRHTYMVGYVVQWPLASRVQNETKRRLQLEDRVNGSDELFSVRAHKDYSWSHLNAKMCSESTAQLDAETLNAVYTDTDADIDELSSLNSQMTGTSLNDIVV